MKFEYLVKWVDFADRAVVMQTNLNELGRDRWELVVVDNGRYIFKRGVSE